MFRDGNGSLMGNRPPKLVLSIAVPRRAEQHDNDDRDLYSGLIRLHVLHHAAKEPIFGLGMLEELARHGYSMSAGTLYPILHGLEKKGYLRSGRYTEPHHLVARH